MPACIKKRIFRRWPVGIGIALLAVAAHAENLLENPSFEQLKTIDRWGNVFEEWNGWLYEGNASQELGQVPHAGRHSALLRGVSQPKIRIGGAERVLEPGRYRVTAFIRGLDIGTGNWNSTTEFMFDGKYMPLKKNGTFGWSKLSYVAEIKDKRKVTGPSFGLWAPGFLWIDDVSLEKVSNETPLSEKPALEGEESPISPPTEITRGAVRCDSCGYRSMPEWKLCYACGTELKQITTTIPSGPRIRSIASFEDHNPFAGKTSRVVKAHATHGATSLRLDGGYTVMDGPQNWSGYDYLKADIYADAADPIRVYVEIRDTSTKDYWTRVNQWTVVPPGASTLILPIKQLYVGEKSRPGRPLDSAHITRLVFANESPSQGPLFIDSIRLERDSDSATAMFDDLYAFDFGNGTSPVMEGFTSITPATIYSGGRGYGLLDTRIWRSFDALQPDPLYQDFICIEAGGLAVDVPNGKYHVVVNIDSPSGFWGEYQVYSEREISAEGVVVVSEKMDSESFKSQYYRFWDVEDSPADNTFDKYMKVYFHEKAFDVEVKDGQLNVAFHGANWACSVTSLIAYPATSGKEGENFLAFVETRRRFHFDNYFKRVLHRPSDHAPALTEADKTRGYAVFSRDYMQDVYYNTLPRENETSLPLQATGFAGEHEPLTFSIAPLRDLGNVTVGVKDLVGPHDARIAASDIDVSFVSYRISRVTMDGAVYTINPRLLMPQATVTVANGVTRTFWLTVKTPRDAAPGIYHGKITLTAALSGTHDIPVEFRVRTGTLDPLDCPAGPWGHTINLPWTGTETAKWNDDMARRSLAKLRDCGFTTFSGMPIIRYKGFEAGKPVFDFSIGDAQMARARQAGFTMPVVSYCPLSGLNLYFKDLNAMKAASYTDYSAFIRTVFSTIHTHAKEAQWLPVYWNLGDEPVGEAILRSAENAEAFHKVFPQGPPYFTAASSYSGDDPNDPHLRLAKALHTANWNSHSETSISLLRQAGGTWAFYNGANRWTFGDYMYKAVKEFDMRFRLSWHWNCVAGDPYYALDCREDDYAWCNSAPDGRLVPSIVFERLREGLDDYRRLLTLARLAEENSGSVAARNGEKLIAQRMASFKLGQRDHDALFGPRDWREFRTRIDDAIEDLR